MTIEERLIEMSKLIQRVTTLVGASLRELEIERGDRALELARDRKGRQRFFYAFAAMIVAHVIFGIYMLQEMRGLVSAMQKMRVAQVEHTISSGLTDVQVQALINLVEQSAPTAQMKEDLKRIGAMKPEPDVLQKVAAAAVVEGISPKDVAKSMVPARPDAGSADSGMRKEARRR